MMRGCDLLQNVVMPAVREIETLCALGVSVQAERGPRHGMLTKVTFRMPLDRGGASRPPAQTDAQMPPALADIAPLPAGGVTEKLSKTALQISLTLPEDCSSLSGLKRLASELELSLDEVISRAVINYVEEVEHDLTNPAHFSRVRLPA